MVLGFDLNHPFPTVDDMDLVDVSLSIRPPGSNRTSRMQTAGLDPVDDEVVICSPRSFAEAREKARRNHRVVEEIHDERDSQRGSSGRSPSEGKNWRRRGRAKPTIFTSGCFINLEDAEETKAKSVAKSLEISSNVPPKEPNFSCPVCMGPLTEETSTKCGHIFCKECINKAIAAQRKCPTCRRKLKAKDTFRIYLPTSY